MKIAALAKDREVARMATRLAAGADAHVISVEWNGSAVQRINEERPSIFLCRSEPESIEIAHALRLLVNAEYCGDVIDADFRGEGLVVTLEDGTSRTLTLPCLLGVRTVSH